MGRDKALLRLGDSDDSGETLVESTVRRLREVCGAVVIADRGRGLVEGVASVADADGAQGPAAGILGAAALHPGADLVVLACDLPRVPPALLAALAALEGDWVVPRWERGPEPLCGVYRPRALAALAALVRDGRFAVHGLLEDAGLAAAFLEGPALHAFGPPAEVFRNLNRPEDLEPPFLQGESTARYNPDDLS